MGRVHDVVQDVVTWSNRFCFRICLPFDNRSRASLRPLLSSNPYAIKFSIDGAMSFVNNIDWLYQFCLTECRPRWRANVFSLSFLFCRFRTCTGNLRPRTKYINETTSTSWVNQFYTVVKTRFTFLNFINFVIMMILINWYWIGSQLVFDKSMDFTFFFFFFFWRGKFMWGIFILFFFT